MPAPEGADNGNIPSGAALFNPELNSEPFAMNSIIYIIGLIVVVMAILSFFGLR